MTMRTTSGYEKRRTTIRHVMMNWQYQTVKNTLRYADDLPLIGITGNLRRHKTVRRILNYCLNKALKAGVIRRKDTDNSILAETTKFLPNYDVFIHECNLHEIKYGKNGFRAFGLKLTIVPEF